MSLTWTGDDDEKPVEGRPDDEDDELDGDLEDDEDDPNDDEDGEWIVDPKHPEYEIFVRDEDEEDE